MANILVVDDFRDTADTAAMWLKQIGHNVQIARDGHQAIELARRQRPHFVLLDIGLPGLDGYAVASTLRQELARPLIIIAITGYGGEDDRRKALAAGCDHYFLKPADPDALIMLFSASNIEQDFVVPDEPQPVVTGRQKRSTLTASRQVELINALGFHLRAAGKFVRIAQEFQATVTVIYDGCKASGKSILDLATLAAACGSRLELEADGPDADAALDALTGLIGRRFEEQE
jgi:phosphotransferase system HPr (HPr) family protein